MNKHLEAPVVEKSEDEIAAEAYQAAANSIYGLIYSAKGVDPMFREAIMAAVDKCHELVLLAEEGKA